MRGWGRLGGGGCCDPGRVSQVMAQWLGWPGKGLPRHPLPQSRAPLPADLTSSCASYTPPSILVAPPDPANPSNSAPALSHLLQEGPSNCPGQSSLPIYYLESMTHIPRPSNETHSWQLLSKLKTHFCRLSRVRRLMCSNMSRWVWPSVTRRSHLA